MDVSLYEKSLDNVMDNAMKMQLKVIKGKSLHVGLDEKYEQRQEHLRQCFQPDAGKDGMDQDGPIPPM
eukprot:8357912-Heterocapsa_arctica.AAC.1